MALITQSSIQAVLDACDMLEIVAPYTTLKKSGANFMGRCPFHSEKTASFSVDPGRKLYYCFGCGEGGNAFTFLEKKEALDFGDAVKQLADKYGVRLQYESSSPEQEQRQQLRERLFSLLEQATVYYSRYLWESSAAEGARRYLASRGFQEPVIREFRLGYAPPGGGALVKAARKKGYTLAELRQAGLISQKEGRSFDRFRGRLIFPFADHRGRVLGFGARVLGDGKPKYLNSPESELYHKGNLVFGLGVARAAIAKADRAFVVEGYTDVLALNQCGVTNVVACMGTALTEVQLKEISRFSKNIYLAFDADSAGEKARLRALELARKLALSVRVVEIPAGQDPAELVFSADGPQMFAQLAEQAPSLLKYQVCATLEAYDLESAEGRVQAYSHLKQIVAVATNAVERDEQLRIIADRLRLSPENVAYLLEESALSQQTGEGRDEALRRVLSQEETIERIFLSLCLARPQEARKYLQDMTEAHFTSELNRAAFLWVAGKLGATRGGVAANSSDSQLLDGKVQSILPELIIKAEADRSAPNTLPELYFRLCEAELSRRISSLKAQLSQDNEASEKFQSLWRLEASRRKILELIQSGSYTDHESSLRRT